MEAVGILTGLAAALGQSLSYIFSRLFLIRKPGGTLELMILSSLCMGIFAAVVLLAMWPADMPPLRTYYFAMLNATGWYVAGQIGLFIVIRNISAGRVVPLLGLKIIILALIARLFMGENITVSQWAGIALSVVSVFMLNFSGERFPAKSFAMVLFTCMSYALADINIQRFMGTMMAGIPLVKAAVISTACCYTLAGSISLLLLPLIKSAEIRQDLKYAVPYSFFWLSGIMFLFACFGTIGAVYGNIIQSTRGLMSILIGALIGHLGRVAIEPRVSHRILAIRVLAALLMTAAIWLYGLGK